MSVLLLARKDLSFLRPAHSDLIRPGLTFRVVSGQQVTKNPEFFSDLIYYIDGFTKILITSLALIICNVLVQNLNPDTNPDILTTRKSVVTPVWSNKKKLQPLPLHYIPRH